MASSALVASLSLLAVASVSGQSDVIGSHEPVNVTIGDDAVLSCHLEPEFDLKTQTVEWRRDQTIVHVYRNNDDDPALQDKRFRGRTSLFQDEMTRGIISLKLTNVTEQDAGEYMCFVPNLRSQVKKGYVTLIVAKPGEKGNKENQNDNPQPQPASDGAIIGLAAFIAMVFIIGLIIFWCLCGRASSRETLLGGSWLGRCLIRGAH
ncbi:butyrophilin-like protein 8 isoform X2 [Acanthopagrus latus]|uniref:butyrophilin-like protein 8 isoform X2 n=1 Tax=Acanthopagrus latus TaxID=8177 RepID=UPI00187BD986|nr:butyrophilin-like protein 8 isoform X2 [Acanthopagrus latus]